MGYKDSAYTYLHHIYPKQVIYMENWEDDPLPYSYIEVQNLIEATSNQFSHFNFEDDEDAEYQINNHLIGNKSFKTNGKNKDKVWSDLAVYDSFLNKSSEMYKQTDKTLLNSVFTKSYSIFEPNEEPEDFTIANYLSNGHSYDDSIASILKAQDINDSIMGTTDLTIPSAFDMPLPSSVANQTRNISGGPLIIPSTSSNVNQTPRINRAREVSNDRLFQTPITRIVR